MSRQTSCWKLIIQSKDVTAHSINIFESMLPVKAPRECISMNSLYKIAYGAY